MGFVRHIWEQCARCVGATCNMHCGYMGLRRLGDLGRLSSIQETEFRVTLSWALLPRAPCFKRQPGSLQNLISLGTGWFWSLLESCFEKSEMMIH